MTCLSWILAKHGLGHDMWMVDFDDITYILYVSQSEPFEKCENTH
jgi:hypothetical protein